MSLKAFRLSLILLAATSLPALSATTQADADKFRDSLKAYVGPMINQMKIVPDGEGYKATFDFNALFESLKTQDGSFSMTPFAVTLTPSGDNKWKMHQGGDMKLAAKFNGGLVDESVSGINCDAILDLTQGIVTDYDCAAKTLVVDEELPGLSDVRAKVHMTMNDLAVKAKSKLNPAGGTDITFTEPFGAMTFVEHIDDGKQPVDINFKVAGGTSIGTIIGFKGKPMLDIWRYAVAHMDHRPTAEDQGTLKTAIGEALPLFQSLETTGNMTKIEVATSIGTFKVDKAGFLLKANGLVKEGLIEEGISVEGLVIPPGIAPEWSKSLVAKNFAVDMNLSGFDLATYSKSLLEAADFTKENPVSVEVLDKLAIAALPSGTITIGLGPSSISGSTYNFQAEGSFVAGPAAQPTGKANIKMKGIDDVMKAINGAPPEASLKQAGAVMILAKGLGKIGADGAITWEVEATPDGKVLVNGTDVKKLR